MEILTRGQRIFRVVGALGLGGVLLILYAPLAVMAVLSFEERTTAVFPPSELTLISYRKLLNASDISLFRIRGEPLIDFLPPLRLSLLLAVLTAVIATALALSAALAFRRRFRGRNVLFYVVLLGMLVPGIALGLGVRLFANEIGLPAAWYTTGLLVHVAWAMPFGFIVFLIFLNRFDRTVEEAAAVLGASPWRVFRTVTLPMLAPGVLGSLLFGFTLSFDEVQRSALALGQDQTLPRALLAATTVRITPVVYALGTVIAVSSLVLVALYLLLLERQRRRVYEVEAAEEEGQFVRAGPARRPRLAASAVSPRENPE